MPTQAPPIPYGALNFIPALGIHFRTANRVLTGWGTDRFFKNLRSLMTTYLMKLLSAETSRWTVHLRNGLIPGKS
jgi:hypothetical protein